MSPSAAVNTYVNSQYGVEPSGLDLSLVTALGITRREKNYLHIVRLIRQSLSN
jgi:hypothetical protein